TSGAVREVSPREYLSELQAREMVGQPDLILQLARHIAREAAQRGKGPVEVYADAQASLNGRRSARLIKPSVDLAALRESAALEAWILPLPP
ncbi:MAG: HTTM domain-containing protein, partial [Polyangiales bacterium]